jgi:RsiW-degrading membrane proteinase PrsW (M82 family)
LLTFVLLGIFLLVAFLVEKLLQPQFTTLTLVITGVVMALVPAVAWIGFFYRQDRLEPEPKSLVVQVFVLGGLLAAAVGIPLVDNLFEVSSWIYTNVWTNLFGAILVIGFSQEFLKYAAVRFSVYNSSEFDERTDGIIYATAAGLGFATVLNLSFIIGTGGVNLGMGAIRVVLTALAQASFAGVTGYFLGREKLEGKPAWWMPLGFILAAVLNGVFFYLWGNLTRASISITGAYVNPWAGLILAVVLAGATTAVLYWLIARDETRSNRQAEA